MMRVVSYTLAIKCRGGHGSLRAKPNNLISVALVVS